MRVKTLKLDPKTLVTTAEKTLKNQKNSGLKKTIPPVTKKAKSSVPSKNKAGSNSFVNKLYAAVPELKSGIDTWNKIAEGGKKVYEEIVQEPGKKISDSLSDFFNNGNKGKGSTTAKSEAREKANDSLEKQYGDEEWYQAQTSQFVIDCYLGKSTWFNQMLSNFKEWGKVDGKTKGQDLAKINAVLQKEYEDDEGYQNALFWVNCFLGKNKNFNAIIARWRQAAWENKMEIAVRGKVSQSEKFREMFPSILYSEYSQREYVYWQIESVLDKVPLFGTFEHFIGNMSDDAEEDMIKDTKELGNKIYNTDIPIISTFFGAMLNADNHCRTGPIASTGGVIGLVGTKAGQYLKGFVDFVANPIETARDFNWMLGKPSESMPTIIAQMDKSFNENMVEGDDESRARYIASTIIDYLIFKGTFKKGTKPIGKVSTINSAKDVETGKGWYNKFKDFIKSGQGTKKKVKINKKSEVDIGIGPGKGGSGSQLKYNPTSGVGLKATPGKTTTILGTYADDTGNILNELGNTKSMDFGPRDGGFNLLNTPDEIYNQLGPDGFWNQCNKPWLDNAIARNDIIVLATEPTENILYRINKVTGVKELSGFGREYQYLIDHGYVFDSALKQMIKK